jgi:histidinol phosphatase-like PHP family hydrolase
MTIEERIKKANELKTELDLTLAVVHEVSGIGEVSFSPDSKNPPGHFVRVNMQTKNTTMTIEKAKELYSALGNLLYGTHFDAEDELEEM